MVMAIAVTVEVVNSLLLIGMLAFARHAWLTMPPGAPFPRLDRAGRLNEEWDFKENVQPVRTVESRGGDQRRTSPA